MKKFTDKVKVTIDPVPGSDQLAKPAPDDFRARFAAAGWSDDPGTGKAVLDEFGREILNPVPMDPPVGFVQEPSMMDLIQRQIARHLASLAGDEVLDETDEEANDFDIVEELDPFSLYEIHDMIPETPSLVRDPGVPPPGGGEGAGGNSTAASNAVAEPPASAGSSNGSPGPV